MAWFQLEARQKKKPEISRIIKKFQAFLCSNWQFTGQSASSWGRGKNRPCFRPTGSNNVHDPGGFLEEPSNKLQQRPRKLCTVLVTALFWRSVTETATTGVGHCQTVINEMCFFVQQRGTFLLFWIYALPHKQCALKRGHGFFLFLLGCFCVYIHCGGNIRMTHDFLNDLQVGFVLAEASAECVPQDMWMCQV